MKRTAKNKRQKVGEQLPLEGCYFGLLDMLLVRINFGNYYGALLMGK